MKIERLKNDEGMFRCFQVDNQKVSRNGMAKMISNLSGVDVTHWPRFYDDEVFCEFKYKKLDFEILEPYGDNTTYDVVAPENADAELEEVASHFEESAAVKGGDLGHAAFFLLSWLLKSALIFGVFYGVYKLFN